MQLHDIAELLRTIDGFTDSFGIQQRLLAYPHWHLQVLVVLELLNELILI